MGNVCKMRTAVAELEAKVRSAAKEQDLPPDALMAESLTELRRWRLQSTCRYVGKSIELAKGPRK